MWRVRGGGEGEGETETATEDEAEGEGGGRVWSVEGEGSRWWQGRGWASSGVVWYLRSTERGECGAGDSVVSVVVLKTCLWVTVSYH